MKGHFLKKLSAVLRLRWSEKLNFWQLFAHLKIILFELKLAANNGGINVLNGPK